MIVRHFHHGRVAAVVAGLVLCAAAAGGLTAGSKHKHSSRAVLEWNAIAAKAFLPTEGTDPLAQSRTFAVLHAAIHDAANAIDPRFASYAAGLHADREASLDAAVAAASRHVLVALVPTQRTLIDDAHALELARLADNSAKDAGIKVGEASARALLAQREHDGSDPASQPVYAPKTAAGEYQFTPPFNAAFFTARGGSGALWHRCVGASPPWSVCAHECEVRSRCH